MAAVPRCAVAAGLRDALRTVGGITTGLLVRGALTVVGRAAVPAASPAAYPAVKLLGSSYLVFLGVQAQWHSRHTVSVMADTGTASRRGPVADRPGQQRPQPEDRRLLHRDASRAGPVSTGRRPGHDAPRPPPHHPSPSLGWAVTCSCCPRPGTSSKSRGPAVRARADHGRRADRLRPRGATAAD
ncbi:LysE family translocator [Streptomyces sp. NBC_01669]|uniref:LysE family translocator n=1 Tax=Streptomyces sp. NBC_01669 TaxID=2975909 RepID=UPI002B1CD6AF|nr:LysE family translocator [Streptomyces sp. NBC_01669]